MKINLNTLINETKNLIYKNNIKNIQPKIKSGIEFAKSKVGKELARFKWKSASEMAAITSKNDIFIPNKKVQKHTYKILEKNNISSAKNIALYSSVSLNKVSRYLSREEKLEFYNNISEIVPEKKHQLQTKGINIDKLISQFSGMLKHQINVITPKKEHQSNFLKDIIANNNTKSADIIKNSDFTQFGKNGIPLKYTRNALIEDINSKTKNLSKNEQKTLFDYFEIDFQDNNFEGIPQAKSEKEVDTFIKKNHFKHRMQNAIISVSENINNFLYNNESTIKDNNLKKVMDSLIKGLPEFTTVIGKKQHAAHDYSIDIHSLEVYKKSIDNPLYNTLSNKGKTILKFSALLHDIAKLGNVKDPGHAKLCSKYVQDILEKFNMPKEVNNRIIEHVNNHHWLASYNTGNMDKKYAATIFRAPEDYTIARIIAKADLSSINKNVHLEKMNVKTNKEFDVKFKQVTDRILPDINNIRQNTNMIMTTPYRPTKTRNIPIDKQTGVRILNLTNLSENENLFKYGFGPGVTKKSFRAFVHVTHDDINTTKDIMDYPQNESVWSLSLVGMKNKNIHSNTFLNRPFGLMVDAENYNIGTASPDENGSGFKKTIKTYFQNDLNNTEKNTKRTFVQDNFLLSLKKSGINLTKQEYGKIAETMAAKKYIAQSHSLKVGDKTITKTQIKQALISSRDALFEHKKPQEPYTDKDYSSEIIAINPTATGIIAKKSNIKDIPDNLISFAKNNNLPILLLGE